MNEDKTEEFVEVDYQAPVPKVYAAISQVQAALAREGIAKARKNSAQGFMFRGIDDVYNVIAALFVQNNLVMLPRQIDRESEQRTTKKGDPIMYTNVTMEYDLISVLDGSKHTVGAFGEAMDSGDKSTNKAMSAAHKYAILQAFTVPTEGDNDPDATAHGDPEPQAMSESTMKMHTDAINTANTRSLLQQVWTTAQVDARDTNDVEGFNELKKLVTARLATLPEDKS